jgi:hypothetical protein
MIRIVHPRSGRFLLPNPEPGYRVTKAPDPGSGSATLPSSAICFFRCEDNLEVKVELPSLSPDPEYSAAEDLPDADTDILGVKEEDLKGAYESETPR